ncbi:hypothetical protein ACFQ0B_54660 [Nonomuraea thailandensis]
MSARAHSPMTAAISTARWIRSAAVDDGHGRHWRANPDRHGRSALRPRPHSLYSGAAGVVLFFLELAAATGHGGTWRTRGTARDGWRPPGGGRTT